MNYKYVTWNNFDDKSITLAAKKKTRLENAGYELVHQSERCSTYTLPAKKEWFVMGSND